MHFFLILFTFLFILKIFFYDHMNDTRKKYFSEIRSFCICAAAFTAVFFILFKLIFGLAVIPDASMEPVFSAGDIVLYQRIFCEPESGDIVIYEAGEKQLAGRITSVSGNVYYISPDGDPQQPDDRGFTAVKAEDIKGTALAGVRLSLNHNQ
jgi:signal peptidase I